MIPFDFLHASKMNGIPYAKSKCNIYFFIWRVAPWLHELKALKYHKR